MDSMDPHTEPLLRRRDGAVLRWVLLALLLAVGGGALWWLLSPLPQGRFLRAPAGKVDSTGTGEQLTIWFVSRQEDALIAESRAVSPNLTVNDRAKAALRELVAGPTQEALRTLPAEVKVRELFIDDQGTAYVDFTEALSRQHPGGPWSEMLTIRSIVQTLTANVPDIKRVQFLIEGREADTLAGHLDIRGPIAPTWAAHPR